MKKPTMDFTKAKQSPASQVGAYVLIALLVTGAVAYLAITPLVQRANKDTREARVYRERVAALEELESSTEKLRTNYDLVAASRDNVLRMVPAGPDEAQLINILFKTAQTNGVSLGSYSPESSASVAGAAATNATDAAPSTSGTSSYAFSISAVSTYAQMKKFIRDLENGPRLMRIQQVQFSSETSGISSGDTVSALILITADYQNATLPSKLIDINDQPEDDSLEPQSDDDTESDSSNEEATEQ